VSEQTMTQNNDDDAIIAIRQTTRRKSRRYKPARCSVCTSFIWFAPIVLQEVTEEELADPPRRFNEWILCKTCYKALLMIMLRSSTRSPARLRIAIGLVASERSPEVSEYVRTQREFSLVLWLLVLFALFHMVIFAIILVPR
jgi:hypothetical protein